MTEKRPTAVSVIGWAAVGVGVILCLSGGIRAFLTEPDPIPSVPRSLPAFVVDLVFGDSPVALLAQALLGLLAGLAGSALLHLRAWGAWVIEAIAWLGVAFTLTATVSVAWELRETPDPERILSIGLLGLVAVSLASPLIIAILVLRSRSVREGIR